MNQPQVFVIIKKVINMDFIVSIDFAILDALQQLRCAFLDWFFAFFSYIGEVGIIWIAAGVALLFFRKTRAAGVMVLTALALGFLIGDIGIKHLIQRPRPFLVNTDVNLFISAPSGFSFPSGHSTAAMAATTVLLCTHKKLGFIALPVAVLIMLSRLYNYVHYPTDVLCGAVLGIFSALVVVFVFRKTGLEKKRIFQSS